MYTMTKQVQCPYCGEFIDIVVDTSVLHQEYIEDCSVCCRPIEMRAVVDGDIVTVIVKRDDE